MHRLEIKAIKLKEIKLTKEIKQTKELALIAGINFIFVQPDL